MVIVHLSDNQRRVIAAEKGETVSQLCQRFCKEISYPVLEFELYSTMTNEALPCDLIIGNIKEVRLIRKADSRINNKVHCYSSIDEKSPQSPAAAPFINVYVPSEKSNKRSAPPPPPMYRLSPDALIEDADVDIPAPPSDPIPHKAMTQSPIFTTSVECNTDQIASPCICHLESYNSSSIDSSEEATPPILDSAINTSHIHTNHKKPYLSVASDDATSRRTSVNEQTEHKLQYSMLDQHVYKPQIEQIQQPIKLEVQEMEKKRLSVDEGYSVDIVDSPKTNATNNYEPIVMITAPQSSAKKFWEPVRPIKQMVFTSKKLANEDVTIGQDKLAITRESDIVSVTATTVQSPLATPDLPQPVEVAVKERIVEKKSGRPEYVPLQPKSLFFTATNK